MSATGSVIVMTNVSYRSPGFSTRYTSDDLWCRPERMPWPVRAPRERHPGFSAGGLGRAEREPELLQQRAALVVGLRRGDHGDVHAADAVDLVLVDLVEHGLLRETEGVVAGAVELLLGEAAEVADPGQREREQAVEELPHAVAAERHVRADRLTLAQLELRDGLASLGDLRLLAGDLREVRDGTVDDLAIAGRLADAHVHDDLHETRHLVHVGVAALLGEGLRDLVPVLGLQSRLDCASLRCRIGHYRSLPDFFA